MTWFKPIAMNIEETMIRPVARGYEEDQEKYGAIDTWPVQEICQEEERHYETMKYV